MKETIIAMEKYAKEYNVPIIEKDSIKFIMKYIELNEVKNILEIGTAIGYSGILMASVRENITLTTIERDEKRYMEAIKNVKKCGLEKKIEVVFQDALDVNLVDRKYDLIFIDAAKGQYTKFFEKFSNYLSPKGVIITDNIKFQDIDNFLNLKVPKNVKGFIIEDIGLLEILKEKGYEVYNFQNHLNNNYMTINFWLKYYDSLVLNNDITKEEIEEICNKVNKPVIISTYGYPMIMYSRRTLVSNYCKNYNLPIQNKLTVKEKISKHSLIFEENEYGTAVFDNKIIDYREILSSDTSKIKYFLFNTFNLTFEEVVNALNGKSNPNESEGFLHTKTVYKIGDLK